MADLRLRAFEEALSVARDVENPWFRSEALAYVAKAMASAEESRISVSLRVSRFGFFTWGVVEASLLTPSGSPAEVSLRGPFQLSEPGLKLRRVGEKSSCRLRAGSIGEFTLLVTLSVGRASRDYSFTLTLTPEQVAEELELVAERISGG